MCELLSLQWQSISSISFDFSSFDCHHIHPFPDTRVEIYVFCSFPLGCYLNFNLFFLLLLFPLEKISVNLQFHSWSIVKCQWFRSLARRIKFLSHINKFMLCYGNKNFNEAEKNKFPKIIFGISLDVDDEKKLLACSQYVYASLEICPFMPTSIISLIVKWNEKFHAIFVYNTFNTRYDAFM